MCFENLFSFIFGMESKQGNEKNFSSTVGSKLLFNRKKFLNKFSILEPDREPSGENICLFKITVIRQRLSTLQILIFIIFMYAFNSAFQTPTVYRIEIRLNRD